MCVASTLCYDGHMSVVAKALLALLLSLPRFKEDTETAEEREQRLTVVSVAIERAAQRATCSGEYEVEGCTRVWSKSARELRMALVTAGTFESHFAQRIHAGHCKPYECDFGRAHSPWQLHRSSFISDEDWTVMHASTQSATDLAAWHAAGALARASGCPGNVGMFSRYMSGGSCTWKGGASRAAFYEKLLKR